MHILPQRQQREIWPQVAGVHALAGEAGEFVPNVAFGGIAVDLLPLEIATHPPDGFGTFAKFLVIHRQCLPAVEIGQGVYSVPQALQDMMELRLADDLTIGLEDGGGVEAKGYFLSIGIIC